MRPPMPSRAAGAALLLLCAAAPALAADKPSAFIDIHVSDMQPSAVKTVRWQGRPYLIVRTSDEMLQDLRAQTPHTWSQRPIADAPAYFVVSGRSSLRGCLLVHASAGAPRYAPERIWQGGFYDPCRFGEWDYAGRTIRQYPDQSESMRRPDLGVPAFELKDRSTLRIGR